MNNLDLPEIMVSSQLCLSRRKWRGGHPLHHHAEALRNGHQETIACHPFLPEYEDVCSSHKLGRFGVSALITQPGGGKFTEGGTNFVALSEQMEAVSVPARKVLRPDRRDHLCNPGTHETKVTWLARVPDASGLKALAG